MKTGTQIRVNKGKVETLVKREGAYGLFESSTYKVVRGLMHIREKEIITRVN